MRAADPPTETLQVHEPMAVTRVRHGNSTTPDPELNPNWTPLRKLLWRAGLVEHETGIRIRITTGCVKVGDYVVPDVYGYSYAAHSGGAYSFDRMWTWLTGFSDGHEQARRHESR